jgi:hypothetical protein
MKYMCSQKMARERNTPYPFQETFVHTREIPLLPWRHPFMPKSLSSGNKNAIKPNIQFDSADYQFPGPTACPPMWLFLSFPYK